MKTITIDNINQDQFEESVDILIDAIRTKYPKLDLRQGTVLRDLLINPDSAINAWFVEQLTEQRFCSSLLLLKQRKESGEDIDPSDVNAVLSNFGMTSLVGTKARGKVRCIISSGADYHIPEGFRFSTIDGLFFEVEHDLTISRNPAQGDIKLYPTSTGFYFIVDVVCTEYGSKGNIEKGTSVSPYTSSIFGLVNSFAFEKFSGGSDIENLDSVINRIPEALSSRSFTSNTSTEAQLRSIFDSTEHPIIAVSSCGYGNPAQRRDKHNMFGVAVGGRVDLYVRNFTEIPIKTITKTGSRNEDGSYTISVSSEDAPGLYIVRQVSDNDSVSMSSYTFSVEYGNSSLSASYHDFDVSSNSSEVANTVWRTATIKAYGINSEEQDLPLKIETVCLPAIESIQSYVDSDSVRNTGSDYVVRCPMICSLSVEAIARYKLGTVFDVEDAKTKIMEYINTSGFIGRVTRSEISSILLDCGAISVDLFNEKMLKGTVFDSNGEKYLLTGDAIDIDNSYKPNGMLTKDTVVFTIERSNIKITSVPVQ